LIPTSSARFRASRSTGDFCGYYVPGGEVIYIGDADAKLAVFDEQRLGDLGVTVDHHGKLPDLVVYRPAKD
jgi:type II restriction enzyme